MSRTSPRLLLVDDDPGAILVMRSLLSDFPDLCFATCGTDALRCARELAPDLVVVDAQMPDMSGLDVCEALRADPELQDIPVIVATAHSSATLELESLEQGALHFVSKPLHPTRFVARVRSALRVGRRLPAAASAPASPAAAPAPGAAPRLLVVDDDPTAIRLLQEVLADLGAVSVAASGAQALELCRNNPPDLVLLDAHMPDMDGFELCAALKSDAALSQVPVVFVTRYADPAREARALDLGAADFVAKPYARAVLKARVRNLLELRRRAAAELSALASRWRQLADDRIADIVRTASDAIVTCDEAGTVLLANAAAADLLGAPCQDIVGHPLARWIDGTASVDAQAGRMPVRLQVCRRDGTRVSAEASTSSLDDAAGTVRTWLLRDVSARDRLEAESSARAAAEAATAAQARLIGWLAHEMGNPLSGLIGFLQIMASDPADPPSESQHRRLAHALESSHLLKRLIGDLLELSRCENHSLHLESVDVDVTALARQCLASSGALASTEGVELALDAPDMPLRARADAQRLAQCVLNLVSNAIKYNRPGGRVTLRLTPTAAALRLDVLDSGLGMNEAQKAGLFEPFNRLGRQHSRIPGTGLGLVITRHLVEAMGGRLEVASEVGQGSRFTIELPREAGASC